MSDNNTYDAALEELAMLFVRTGLYSSFKMIEDETGSYFGNVEHGNVLFVTEFREKRMAIECMKNIDLFASYVDDLEKMWKPVVKKVMPLCEIIMNHAEAS